MDRICFPYDSWDMKETVKKKARQTKMKETKHDQRNETLMKCLMDLYVSSRFFRVSL